MPWWSKKKTESELAVQVKLEVQKVLEHVEMQGNSADNSGIRARIAQAISGGYDNADTLHNVYLDYGYPQILNFSNYWNMYRRFGIARNIVELPVDVGWMQLPTVKGTDRFNKDLEILAKKVKLWNRLRALDIRQRVGRYAGMFIRVRDGLKPSEPIKPGSLNGVNSVIQLIPIYEGQLKVSATETDPMKDDFGLPTLYEFNTGSTGNRNEQHSTSFSIHPSRIVIAAEGADNGGIYGISSLEAPYNSLMDLRKIIGAGGEGFYKNAAQNIVFTLKDMAGFKGNEKLLEKFNESYDEFAANRFRRSMLAPGLEPNVLDSKLIQPKEFFDNALNDTAAASKIAATILIGQQTGRLASDQDSRQFLSGINSRRENFQTDVTRDMIDWFILTGVLPFSEYEIEWTDLLELSQEDRLNNAGKMSEINERQFKSGADASFSSEEVREQAGFDPEELPEPEGETVDDIEEIVEDDPES